MTATLPETASPKPGRPLVWRLSIVMAERGLRTAAQLHRRLEPYGLDISVQQVTRIVSHMPMRLNTEVLAALTDALECTTAELLHREGGRVATAKSTRQAANTTESLHKAPRREAGPIAPPIALPVTPSVVPTPAPSGPATPAHVLGPNVSSLVAIVVDLKEPTGG